MSQQRRPNPWPAVSLVALLTLAVGCGGGEGKAETKVSDAPSAGVVAPAKVEVIAGLIGCKSDIRTEADELREGTCHSTKGDYIITTFPKEQLKETWLDSASMYGGTYLVGTRWVVSAKKALLVAARSEVGGTIEKLGGTTG